MRLAANTASDDLRQIAVVVEVSRPLRAGESRGGKGGAPLDQSLRTLTGKDRATLTTVALVMNIWSPPSAKLYALLNSGI
jgi:hypothetical protein